MRVRGFLCVSLRVLCALCGSGVLFYRKERKGRAKKRKGKLRHTALPGIRNVTGFITQDLVHRSRAIAMQV